MRLELSRYENAWKQERTIRRDRSERRPLIQGVRRLTDRGASMFGSIFGVKLFFNPLCLEKTTNPARPYKRRRWQSEAQYARKSKKWIKRWGYAMKPCMYKTPLGFFAHPALKAEIERAIGVEHTVRQYTDQSYGRKNGLIFVSDVA